MMSDFLFTLLSLECEPHCKLVAQGKAEITGISGHLHLDLDM